MPRKITITISDLVAHKLELMGMDANKVCNAMVEWYLTDYDKDIGLIFMIEHARAKIRQIENEVIELEYKKNIVKKLKAELGVLEQIYADSEGKLETQYLLTYLNRRIIAYHYDINEITKKQSDIIEKIKKANPKFDLRKHIDKVRLLREQTML